MADIFARIQSATDGEVRAVLKGLCKDATTRKRAESMFHQLDVAAEAHERRELAPPTLHVCVNCSMAFSEASNTRGSCRYHPGIVEIDYESEAWADHYGDEVHDSESMREDNPEGLIWTCCEESLEAPRCTRSAHRQGGAKRASSSPMKPTGNKRARYVPSPRASTR
ncbi:hypothetical protein N658DRAFT_481132 [Parathielavia hyrcaniae]|uniref:C2H2-type domain-containing protein n=1 Tax=Parathielavia hyrcaniae TaxID=113614 RepID=A0AAN6PQL5_9PEZI|nr:hypothetical protein N658DRAFT_481132 [Parathielavia hyrcaniae]